MHVITKNYIQGLHYWKDAPQHLDYLRNKHRHIFEIVCHWNVSHCDREIEIIETQNMIEQFFKVNYYREKYGMCDFDNLSCENICEAMLSNFKSLGLCKIEVLEDGQGGAICQV